MHQDRLALLALHFIPGLGDYLIRQLVSYCGSADRVFKMPKGKLLKIPGVGTITADVIKRGEPFRQAESESRKAEELDVELVFFTDGNYPSRLKQINDAPTLIYRKGKMNFENPKTVAIVGTRKATEYGKHCVESLVEGLAPHQACIVSGLAYGIDIHAHKQALACGLETIGVMGSGMDVIYPSAHRETVRKMYQHGGLVTEHPFGTPPDAHNFPARNRIVAGLCDAIVIVEAASKGGALITADIANSYNKDVFAFPGNIGQHASEGCNHLIKTNKAFLITSVRDLEYLMNWSIDVPHPVKKGALNLAEFSESEKPVIITLSENKNQLMIDELSWKTGLPVGELAAILLNLEFRGIVTSLPGKVFKLSRPL